MENTFYKLSDTYSRTQFKGTRGIYAIVHNGEYLYIGQSVELYKRLTYHNCSVAIERTLRDMKRGRKKHTNDHALDMYKYIDAHRDEIQFTILEEWPDNLNEREKFYIEKYKPRFNTCGVSTAYIPQKVL